MPLPRVLILRAPGTNCDLETAHAFERAGAAAERLHVNGLLDNPARLRDAQIVCIPGGFSYGDDIAAGRILANQIRHHLQEELRAFQQAGKLVLGICNGFQVLIKSGLLLGDRADRPLATLTWNDSGRFEDRWVRLRVANSRSVFLQGIEEMQLPVAHAEGKFVAREPSVLDRLEDNGQLALRYASERTDLPVVYPQNPNGSQRGVAGVCDESGLVFGLMPHPERHIEPTQHPHWTRTQRPEVGDGLAIFRNAVRYFA
jgi:phosphoribosylformylglycinamidine synthase